MEEKRKSNIGIIICIVIIILLIVALFGMWYYYNHLNKQKEPINDTTSTNTPTESKKPEEQEKPNKPTETNISNAVPIRDQFSVITGVEGNDVFIAYLQDGNLYYTGSLIGLGKTGGHSNLILYSNNIDEEGRNIMKSIKKYEGLSNIKRIKTFDASPMDYVWLYLVTEDGKVYLACPGYGESKIVSITELKLFNGYKVDDILNRTSVIDEEVGCSIQRFEVLLQDGSRKII